MSAVVHSPLRLGLTGGIGCGKSSAVAIFHELGFAVIESDAVVRELWDKDAEVKQAAIGRWGTGITESGSKQIDRHKVAAIVFSDTKELDWLEGLLHPRVSKLWRGAVAAEPQKEWVVEIPLLFEKNLASDFNFTLCITSSPALQATRLAARGLSPADIAARQARQWPLQQKIDRADFVALNDGSLNFLRQQIVQLAARLRGT